MIWTIGIKENYDKWLKEAQPLKKKAGGSVWETYSEALAVAEASSKSQNKLFGVYGVEADWRKDTHPPVNTFSTFRALNVDAIIDPKEIDVVFPAPKEAGVARCQNL